MRFWPTSMTIAPGLIQSPRTISARPAATYSRSARRHTAGICRVREWAMVTVAFSASSSWASGLPTMLERPTTTASQPASEGETVLVSRMQPSGVQGTSAGRPPLIEGAHSGRDGVAALAAHIGGARRILADEHDGKAGDQPVLRAEPAHRGGDLRPQVRPDRLAVDDPRPHPLAPPRPPRPSKLANDPVQARGQRRPIAENLDSLEPRARPPSDARRGPPRRA